MIEQAPNCCDCGKPMTFDCYGGDFRTYSCIACGVITSVPGPALVPLVQKVRKKLGITPAQELPPTVMASREERQENLRKALQKKVDELEELREEWDFGLQEVMHPFLRRKINRYFEPKVAELQKVVEVLQERWATVRDELGESPEAAGARDGYIAWLEEHWGDKYEQPAR